MDCTVNEAVCKKFEVKGYPTGKYRTFVSMEILSYSFCHYDCLFCLLVVLKV